MRSGMGLTEAIALARTEWEARQAAGLNQGALDAQARHGLALGAFEESAEEAGAILEEFFPPTEDRSHSAPGRVRPERDADQGGDAVSRSSTGASFGPQGRGCRYPRGGCAMKGCSMASWRGFDSRACPSSARHQGSTRTSRPSRGPP